MKICAIIVVIDAVVWNFKFFWAFHLAFATYLLMRRQEKPTTKRKPFFISFYNYFIASLRVYHIWLLLLFEMYYLKMFFFFELEKLKFCIYFTHVIFIIQQSTLLNLIVSNSAKSTKYLTYIHTNKRRNTVHKLKHTYICKPVRTCCTKNVYKNRNFVVKAMWTQIKQSHEKRNKNTKSNNNKDSSKSILYKHIYKQICQQSFLSARVECKCNRHIYTHIHRFDNCKCQTGRHINIWKDKLLGLWQEWQIIIF